MSLDYSFYERSSSQDQQQYLRKVNYLEHGYQFLPMQS